MRVMFWAQGAGYLNYALAVSLKRKYGIKDFSAIALGKKNYTFLKNQKEIKIEPLALWQEEFSKYKKAKIDHDYLSSLEKKYGIPTLWMYPTADRDLLNYNYRNYTYEEFLKIMQVCFKFVIEFLKEAKPDYIIMPLGENIGVLIVHEVARDMKIPTLMFNTARMEDRFTISRDTYEGFDKIFKIYDELKRGRKSKYEKKAADFIKNFRARETTPYHSHTSAYVSQDKFFKSMVTSPGKHLARALNYSRERRGHFKDDYMYEEKPPIKLALHEVDVLTRRMALSKSSMWEEPDYNEKYVYYAPHYEPEISTMLMGPFYLNQPALIENIAKSLPVTYRLYVKEHPMMLGFRPSSYYERLREMPNVKLIHPAVSSYELIKNSQLVMVITGTPGWEAVLLGKPVITFGRVYFNRLSTVKYAGDAGAPLLSRVIREMIEKHKPDEKELVKFVAAMYEGSFSVDFSEITEQKSADDTIRLPSFPGAFNAIASEMGLKVKP